MHIFGKVHSLKRHRLAPCYAQYGLVFVSLTEGIVLRFLCVYIAGQAESLLKYSCV